jgi:hypothetical protein
MNPRQDSRPSLVWVRIVLCMVLIALIAVPLLAQDPVTIFKTGTALVELYNALNDPAKKDAGMASINAQLGAINLKLEEISRKLDDLHSELVTLGVKIDETADKQSRDKVLANIRVIAADYRGWSRNPVHYRAEIKEQLRSLKLAASELMERDSFSSYHLLGLAMLYEHYLYELSGTESTFRQDRFSQYERYFADASNANLVGSIAQRAAVNQTIAQGFVAAHIKFQQWPLLTQYMGKDREGSGHGEEICKFHIHNVIAGNIDTGYRFTGVVDRRNKHDCSTPRRETIGGGRDHVDLGRHGVVVAMFTGWFALSEPAGDCPAISTSTFDTGVCLSDLNADVRSYQSAKRAFDTLNPAIPELQFLAARAHKFVQGARTGM